MLNKKMTHSKTRQEQEKQTRGATTKKYNNTQTAQRASNQKRKICNYYRIHTEPK